LPIVLCIDEVYAKKLVKYSYCCVLYAPQWRKIVDVLDPKLQKAYELKEECRNFVATATIDNANDELNILISKFKEAHIPEYSSFIKTLNNWHNEIVNSFNTINGHKITNDSMERVNSDIKIILGISFGSINFPRMRNKIIYCVNQDVPILAWRKKETNKKVGKPRGKYKTKSKKN
jgi:hypothetical protein